MRAGARKAKAHDAEGHQKRSVRHARNRFGERYGRHLGEPEYWALVAAIQRPITAPGPTRRIYKQSRRKSWHVVEVGGVKAIAVYDFVHRRITTFLSPAALADIGLPPAALELDQGAA